METIKVYKLFRQDNDGCLHPLFIDRERVLMEEEWEQAWAPDIDKLTDTREGFHFVDHNNGQGWYRYKRPSFEDVVAASYLRGRWIEIRQGKRKRLIYDIGIGSDGQVLRFAHRPGWHLSAEPRLPSVDMTGKVWAECLIPANDHYIIRRNISGLSREHEPIEWYISQQMLIVRVLTNATQST